MKVKQLFDKAIEKWPVKAICFGAALFLYLFHQGASLEKKVFTVPLSVEMKNGFVAAEPHPNVVTVFVTGKSEELAQVRDKDIAAYLDLNYVSKDGKYDFPVLLSLADTASVLNPLEIKVMPETVRLSVEQEISGYVELEPLIKGKPAYGYELKSVSLHPSQVKITGPRTMVSNCKMLQTKGISVENAKRSFSSQTSVDNKIGSLRIDDADVITATLDVDEVMTSKVFNNLPVNLTNIDSALEVKSMKSTVSVNLSGALVDLEKYIPSSFMVLADCSEIHEPGTYDVKLAYVIPSSFSAGEGNAETVSVTFMARRVEEEKISVMENPFGIPEERVIESGVDQ